MTRDGWFALTLVVLLACCACLALCGCSAAQKATEVSALQASTAVCGGLLLLPAEPAAVVVSCEIDEAVAPGLEKVLTLKLRRVVDAGADGGD